MEGEEDERFADETAARNATLTEKPITFLSVVLMGREDVKGLIIGCR